MKTPRFNTSLLCDERQPIRARLLTNKKCILPSDSTPAASPIFTSVSSASLVERLLSWEDNIIIAYASVPVNGPRFIFSSFCKTYLSPQLSMPYISPFTFTVSPAKLNSWIIPIYTSVSHPPRRVAEDPLQAHHVPGELVVVIPEQTSFSVCGSLSCPVCPPSLQSG